VAEAEAGATAATLEVDLVEETDLAGIFVLPLLLLYLFKGAYYVKFS
jgi:hypothetical protein